MLLRVWSDTNTSQCTTPGVRSSLYDTRNRTSGSAAGRSFAHREGTMGMRKCMQILSIMAVAAVGVIGAGCLAGAEEPSITSVVSSAIADHTAGDTADTEQAAADQVDTELTAAGSETSELTAAAADQAGPGSLEMLREAAAGCDLAVAYLGGSSDLSADNDDWWQNWSENDTMASWPFIREIGEENQIGWQGDDIYCIVPVDPGATVRVCELSLGSGDDFELVEGDTIYEWSEGTPFLLRCNVSDIMPDVRIYVRDSSGEHIYSPSLSLEDGQLYVPDSNATEPMEGTSDSESAADTASEDASEATAKDASVYDFTVYDMDVSD